MGTLLNVKPILTLKDGLVHPHEKVRGRSKALARLISLMEESFGPGSRLQCWITHGDFPEGLEEVKIKMAETFDCAEILTGRLGPVVGTHAGPGLVGLICLPVKD